MERYILWYSARFYAWTLLRDLFYFPENTGIASYAMITLSIQLRKTVINATETSSQVIFHWFSDNFMKAKSGKNNLVMSGTEATQANVDGSMINSNQKGILLGINLDNELKFEDHVHFMCKKAS